jgi:hypothetical protein
MTGGLLRSLLATLRMLAIRRSCMAGVEGWLRIEIVVV